MNLKTLPKQQRDMLILGVMGVVTAVMVISNLVLSPAKAKAAAAAKVITELEPKVRKADTILRSETRIQASIQKISSEILEAQDKHLPPEGSRYLWALQQISDIGHTLGIPLNVREHAGTRYIPHRATFAEVRSNTSFWVPYAVEVNMQTSFGELQLFLQKLSASNAYASLAKLEITPSVETPQKHKISLIVEWPVPRDPAALAALRSELEKPK